MSVVLKGAAPFLVSAKLTLLHTITVNVHFNVAHVAHVEQTLIYQHFEYCLTWHIRGTYLAHTCRNALTWCTS